MNPLSPSLIAELRARDPEYIPPEQRPILAVPPVNGAVFHLYREGYQPGRKRRSIGDSASLCGVGIHGHPRVPLAEALAWPNPAPASLLTPARTWSWCRVCVGHAVAIAGLSSEVLASVSAARGEGAVLPDGPGGAA